MISSSKPFERATIALASAGVALLVMAASPLSHVPVPTPMPSARDCAYFKHLYPATVQSFDRHHLSMAQRKFIMKYVNKIPPAERRFAMWAFDEDIDEGLLIYDAFPVRPDDAVGSHAAWMAMNTNVAFDPIECRPIITPVAMQVQVRVGNGRI
jgi:hypothetical protein